MGVQPGLLAVGLALLGATVIWRGLHRRRWRRALERAVADPRPAVRLAALQALDAAPIRPYARLVGSRTAAETDPELLVALALLLRTHRWESGAGLQSLQPWADRVIKAQPAANEGA